MATQFNLVKITDLTLAQVTPFSNSFFPVAFNGDTFRLGLDQFRNDLFTNPTLTGNVIVPTANAGDNSERAASTRFVQNTISGLGLGVASATNFGTVRTNTTVAVPVVYLKEEIDQQYNTVRPVTLGGTGGTNQVEARNNLGAARSGSNNDITQLTALEAVPTVVQTAIESLLPPGSITLTASASAPQGWLICDGSAVSRTVFARLFQAIGTTYGAGDNSTTFNLPNLRGRVALGAGVSAASGTTRNLGSVGGADTHTLNTTEIASHGHSGTTQGAGDHSHTGWADGAGDHAHTAWTDAQGNHQHGGATDGQGNHQHSFDAPAPLGSIPGGGSRTGAFSDGALNDATTWAGFHAHNIVTDFQGNHGHSVGIGVAGNHGHNVATYGVPTHTHAYTTGNTGGGLPHNNLQPFIALHYIIKA